jgi:hypothetical protein
MCNSILQPTANDAEKNYSVQEQECLGVKFTVDKFRHFLLATPFVSKCLSAHHSLQLLKKGKETGGRIARWALALFTIYKGRKMW